MGDEKVVEERIVALAQIGEPLAVGGKSNGAVYILDKQTRSSAEHGRGIERRESMLRLIPSHAVNIIGIGGKGQPRVTRGSRGNELRVAPRSDVPEPERL